MIKYVSELRALVATRPLILCGANVILIDGEGRVLFHHRRDNDTWGLPGGFMELGESLEQTAAREVREEVGLTCHALTLFGLYSGPELYYRYPDGNEVHNVTASYLCRDFSGEVEVDQVEGRTAAFFAAGAFPQPISPAVRVIVDDLRSRYAEVVAGP